MPCLIGCLALATPRLAVVLVVIFSDFIGRAYQHDGQPGSGQGEASNQARHGHILVE